VVGEAAKALSLLLSSPDAIGFVLLGTLIGVVFGAIPGISGLVALSLVIPLTFGMDSVNAMFLYAGIMGGNPLGGSISAIIINTPGTVVNAATCFDGYPMTQRGEAGRALGISATASGLGALFGLIVLVAVFPVVRIAVTSFGPAETFAFILFGLMAIVVTAQGNMLKGLFSGGLGIILAFIGESIVTGEVRYNFSTIYLWDGIQLIPLVIGVFALAEMINLTVRGKMTVAPPQTIGLDETHVTGIKQGIKDVFVDPKGLLRGSAIGTLVGIVPGVGGAAANFISYTAAMQSSKHPERFGTGAVEGVLASECANNSKEGGSLIPTLGFGIPGSGEMAILMGAFIIHGFIPGPLLMGNHPEIVWALIWGLVAANVVASSFVLVAARYLCKLTTVNLSYIIPIVVGL